MVGLLKNLPASLPTMYNVSQQTVFLSFLGVNKYETSSGKNGVFFTVFAVTEYFPALFVAFFYTIGASHVFFLIDSLCF